MENSGHGLILGKFLPPHAGHLYLVRFGREFCRRITVLVCSIAREPIPGELRFAWMRELFPDCRVLHIDEELPQEPAEHPDFWEIWRRVITQAVGEPIDYVFASDDYGSTLAVNLGATFVPCDPGRTLVPVSGTAIRARPLANWEFIPPCVRPYFVRRVCVFGPESTGKSTLARDLAAHFHTVHVPEFARGWLDPRGGTCAFADIPIIARGQMASEDALARSANRVLICDTDVLTTTIWSDYLFGECPDWVRQSADGRRYDLHLLLDIDAPWVDDRQRFLPHARREFFELCRTALERGGRPYRIIRGDWDQRLADARAAVAELL